MEASHTWTQFANALMSWVLMQYVLAAVVKSKDSVRRVVLTSSVAGLLIHNELQHALHAPPSLFSTVVGYTNRFPLSYTIL